jgi:hypothetical protein
LKEERKQREQGFPQIKLILLAYGATSDPRKVLVVDIGELL